MDATSFVDTASGLWMWRAAACALYAVGFGLAWAGGCRALYPSLRRRTPSLRKDDYAKICAPLGVAACLGGIALIGDGPVVARAFSMSDKGAVCETAAALVAEGGEGLDPIARDAVTALDR